MSGLTLDPQHVADLADEMGVLPEDVCHETIAAYMDELNGRVFAAEDEEELGRRWAEFSGVSAAPPSRTTEADRLLADPETQRCLNPRDLDDLASCYRSYSEPDEEDSQYAVLAGMLEVDPEPPSARPLPDPDDPDGLYEAWATSRGIPR